MDAPGPSQGSERLFCLVDPPSVLYLLSFVRDSYEVDGLPRWSTRMPVAFPPLKVEVSRSSILAYRPITRVPLAHSFATLTQPLAQLLLRYLSIIVTIFLMVRPWIVLHGHDKSRVAHLDVLGAPKTYHEGWVTQSIWPPNNVVEYYVSETEWTRGEID